MSDELVDADELADIRDFYLSPAGQAALANDTPAQKEQTERETARALWRQAIEAGAQKLAKQIAAAWKSWERSLKRKKKPTA